jgi:hypothetical protein
MEHTLPTTPRRTRRELAADLAFVLRSPLHLDTKRFMIRNVVWEWTKGPRRQKYHGCAFWSTGAVTARQSDSAWKKQVHHEHAVPIASLAAILLDLDQPTADEVHDLMDRLAIGVVVTRDEHAMLNNLRVGGVRLRSRMPAEFDHTAVAAPRDVLGRYRAAKISLRRRKATV